VAATELETAVELKKTWEQVALFLFIVVPFVALVAAVPLLWGRGLDPVDLVIALTMYLVTGHGVTIGFHRLFAHRAFRAVRPLQAVLAVAGSMAVQGPVIRWVADHRRHHRFTDRDGDPHSPWRYGRSVRGVARGLFYSHLGWLFDVEQTPEAKYAPELCADPMISRISRNFPLWVVVSMLLPPLVGGLWTGTLVGAWWAFFWGSLVRVALLHHVTFSINSVCHVTGRRPFRTRDESRNVWWLALPSFGEAWHNFHHADPTSARHGVRRFEIDTSAILIRIMERLRWVDHVRWPDPDSIARRRVSAPVGS
jgi:stearoyl-CoA desaturase (delta-9 desaturase)